MTLIEFLKAKWTIFGLDAPIFTWLAAAGLLIGTLCALSWLWWLVRREQQIHSSVTNRLKALHSERVVRPGEGLSGSTYDAVVQIFLGTPPLLSAWRGFNSQMVPRRIPTGEEHFYASESAESAFSDAVVIDSRLNRSFFIAIPGVVTGSGLLFTFLAILVALLDVKLVNNRVQGLELLIQGLSGKFVSSISGLGAATFFLLSEKPLLHRLTISRQALVSAIDDLIPRLSPAQLLADIHRDIAEQSNAFRLFNADLSTKLRRGFSESMGPTIERMVRAVDDLNQLLRAAEAQRQDALTSSIATLLRNFEQIIGPTLDRMSSTVEDIRHLLQTADAQSQDAITGSIESLLQNLERSMAASLEQMSGRFSESLSGSAMQQFDRVAESLGGTARLLEGMNVQFQTTQSALNELINFARNSTADQMALGRTQVEELTAVLRGLMTQIHETAGSSVNQMAATLTTVVHDLSTKVTELGEKMSSSMLESAELATDTAGTVIENAKNWSSQNAEQLTQLLERHEGHLGRIEDIRTTLDTTLARFKEALGQYTTVTTNLKEISAQVSALATSAAGVTRTMQSTQEAIQRVAGSTAQQVDRLAEAHHRQEETWQQVYSNMRQYEQVFSRVEESTGRLLGQINEHLNNYTATSRQGFEDLTRVANEHFRNATERLGASVQELQEYLDDLNETLERTRSGRGNSGGRS